MTRRVRYPKAKRCGGQLTRVEPIGPGGEAKHIESEGDKENEAEQLLLDVAGDPQSGRTRNTIAGSSNVALED